MTDAVSALIAAALQIRTAKLANVVGTQAAPGTVTAAPRTIQAAACAPTAIV